MLALPAFAQYLLAREADPRCGRLKLRDWLLTIVRRCPRYLLLLCAPPVIASSASQSASAVAVGVRARGQGVSGGGDGGADAHQDEEEPPTTRPRPRHARSGTFFAPLHRADARADTRADTQDDAGGGGRSSAGWGALDLPALHAEAAGRFLAWRHAGGAAGDVDLAPQAVRRPEVRGDEGGEKHSPDVHPYIPVPPYPYPYALLAAHVRDGWWVGMGMGMGAAFVVGVVAGA
ncbi:hypothetical protein B0H17DRAFT_1203925 [Mycena rosella]|uniref:Uncharacterized protein n=1 Tax=Mycena rosella TaxID=1033263 RepID=A0AAD7GE87_MYCRO|nr:hypothetical protein B0H17DRAFT_1203925 [Mycena rosella]